MVWLGFHLMSNVNCELWFLLHRVRWVSAGFCFCSCMVLLTLRVFLLVQLIFYLYLLSVFDSALPSGTTFS